MSNQRERSKTYDDQEVHSRLKESLPRWQLKNGFICRTYRTHGWKGTLMVVNAVAHLAEAAWHHPDVSISYASVEVRLQTHDAGGITDKDFELARKIEDVVMWQPGQESGALTGTPQERHHAYLKYD